MFKRQSILEQKLKIKSAALQSPDAQMDLEIPGSFPYEAGGARSMAVSPVTKEDTCTVCGTCASVCPTAAISINGSVATEIELCIRCCACIKNCPTGARVMEDSMWKNIANWLNENCSTRKEPQIFGIDVYGFALLSHIRYLVSHSLNYGSCMDFNRLMLKKLGLKEDDIKRIETAPAKSLLEDNDAAMLVFVVTAVKEPSSVKAEEIERLKKMGWRDQDLVDALAHGVNMIDHSIMMEVFQMVTDKAAYIRINRRTG
jgi:ferredoxin